MKRKITLLLLAAGSIFTMNSQVMIQENFTSPFNPATNGWSYQNLTTTAGQTWFQGNPAVFNSFNGAPADYLACNWASSTNTLSGETISNWLITPVVTIANGAVLEFATRTNTNPAQFPDRLQISYSMGNGTNVGASATSVGTFSNVIVDINSGLTLTGYPGTWTVYSMTLSGVVAPGLGRIGFRYFVTNGGPAQSAVNSDFIGLDAVKYFIPCGATVGSYTICSGASATLQAMGAANGSTFNWSPVSSTSSFVIDSPSGTTTYSLDYDEGNGACPTITGTITIGPLLSVNIAASSTTVCSGTGITLSAISAAQNFSWSSGQVTQAITFTPTASGSYSVGAYNGSLPFPSCFGGNSVQITVNQTPTVDVIAGTGCTDGTDGTITFTASGAVTYTVLGQNTAVSTFTLSDIGAEDPGPYNFIAGGTAANGCVDLDLVSFTVEENPLVTATTSSATPCIGKNVTISVSGADDYQWSGANTSTSVAFSYSSSTAGLQSFTVVGTDATTGCSDVATVTISVKACNFVGIAEINGGDETGIFPNPFTTEIKINTLDGKVVIYNAIGQVVVNTPVRSSETINTSELPKGAYLVRAYNTNGELVKTVKLIKN